MIASGTVLIHFLRKKYYRHFEHGNLLLNELRTRRECTARESMIHACVARKKCVTCHVAIGCNQNVESPYVFSEFICLFVYFWLFLFKKIKTNSTYKLICFHCLTVFYCTTKNWFLQMTFLWTLTIFYIQSYQYIKKI